MKWHAFELEMITSFTSQRKPFLFLREWWNRLISKARICLRMSGFPAGGGGQDKHVSCCSITIINLNTDRLQLAQYTQQIPQIWMRCLRTANQALETP